MKPSILKLAGSTSLLAILAGCAAPVTKPMRVDHVAVDTEIRKQRELALQSWLAMDARISDVAYPLLVAAHPYCTGNQTYYWGARYGNKHSYGKESVDAAVSLRNMSDAVQIMHVVPGSPADQAGLKENDIVVAVNDRPIPETPDSPKRLGAMLAEESKAGPTIRTGRPWGYAFNSGTAGGDMQVLGGSSDA